jgi:hypothetical protein
MDLLQIGPSALNESGVKDRVPTKIVTLKDPFWGPVALDRKTFEQVKVYQDIKRRIETVVNLPAFTDELFPQDIASMLKSRTDRRHGLEMGVEPRDAHAKFSREFLDPQRLVEVLA